MSTHTFTNKRSITHKWIIHDFKDYFDVDCIREKYSLSSSHFSLHEYPSEFSIEVSVNPRSNTEIANWLSLTVHEHTHIECNEKKMIKYQVYLLNDKNTSCNFNEARIITENVAEWSWPQFCDLTKLYNEDKNLLSNNNLTIVCDIFIYNHNSNVELTYKIDQKNLINDDLSVLLNNEDYCDVNFLFDDGEKIAAHKLILMARSIVFEQMFPNFDNGEEAYYIEDIDSQIFRLMIKYIYTDKVDPLPHDEVIKLIYAANKYKLYNLLDICGNVLHKSLRTDNAMDILKLAERYDLEKLKICTTKFIKANKQNILKTLSPEYFEKNLNHAFIFLF